LKKKTARKHDSDDDSSSDSDDEGAECSICAEDDIKMVDLQRVRALHTLSFFTSCNALF
jgi:hypothetical protein